jgi:RHS repeat-associated protein
VLFAFTGREWDGDLQLYYYRARWYDPKAGRFISEDPARWGADSNLYRYVRNAPGNLLDPSGLEAMSLEDVQRMVHGHNASGLSDALVVCIIWKESNFDPNAVNGSAQGLMQFQPPATQDVGGCACDRNDPNENVVMGTTYLKVVTKRNKGNVAKALDHFGDGPGYANNVLDCEKCLLSCSSKEPFEQGRNALTCLHLIHQ